MTGSVRPKFVVMGSSIVQYNHFEEGWGAILTHLYARKADIIFRGYSAWNSKRAVDILHDVFPKTLPEQPALAIVYFGGNDSTVYHSSGLGPHVPLEDYVNNMRTIALHLKELSDNTRIIFLSTPPIDDDKIPVNSEGNKEKTNELCKQYSEACLDLCRDLDLTAIDLWNTLQDRDDWKDVYLFPDGVHLSPEGSKVVAKEILKVLKKPDWTPSLHWKSMPSEFGEDSEYDPVAPDGNSTINVSNFAYPHDPEEWD